MIIEPARFRLMITACASVTSSITSENRIRGRSWSFSSAPRPVHVLQVRAVHLEHAELALHEQDARLDTGHSAQREIGDPLDGQRRRHLHDERVLPGERRVAAGARRGAQVRGELRLQVSHQEVDPQLRGRRVVLVSHR
jgi:hypothetical protein